MAGVLYAKPYKVTASKLNVRNAPEKSGAVVGSLTSATVIDVRSINGGWAEIKYNGRKAYVSAQYLTPVSGTTSKSTISTSTQNKNTTTSKNTSSGKTTSSKSGTLGEPVIGGFHLSLGAAYNLRSMKVYQENIGWKPFKLGKNNNIGGLSVGLGLEYNGVLRNGARTNLQMGVKTGFYYNWYGTVDLSKTTDYESLGYDKYRISIHSLTIPLEPVFSIEWLTGRGKHMGFGIYTGPVFEFLIAENIISEQAGIKSIKNMVSGKTRIVKGDAEAPERAEKDNRAGIFNFMWATGAYLQFGKFRFKAETDWGICKYKLTRHKDGLRGHLNSPLVIGVDIVF